jgi:hypothetical protein
MTPKKDPARETILRFGNGAARRRDHGVECILRAVVGGVSFTSQVVLRHRAELVRALEDLEVARLVLAALEELDAMGRRS